MSLARTLDLCDAAAEAIADAWEPTGDDAVERAYAPDVGLTADNPDTLLRGRKVYVFPAAYSAPLLDRNSLYRRHTFAVLVVERYTEGAGFPPRDWIDERVTFTEQKVFDLLRNPARVLSGSVVTEAFPDLEADFTVEPVYDLDLLIESHTYWSQAVFTYLEPTDLTGD